MLSDGDKPYLRVHPRGGKSSLSYYVGVNGNRIKLTLGAEQRHHIALGKDPRIKKHEERQEAVR